jgi:hypothetical protein
MVEMNDAVVPMKTYWSLNLPPKLANVSVEEGFQTTVAYKETTLTGLRNRLSSNSPNASMKATGPFNHVPEAETDIGKRVV